MNSRQIKYAIMLSKTKNFTQVADELGISQPALSKQIQYLERDLGISLFDRNSSPLRLTPAGEYFINEAKDLLYKEEQLYRTLEKYKTDELGRLTIGCSPFRTLYLLPEVINKVQSQFPNVEIIIHETNSYQLKQDAEDAKFDFAIVNLPVDDNILDAIPMPYEELVLAVPKSMMHLLASHDSTNTIDIRDCANLPFVVLSKNQEMRELFDSLCSDFNFHPKIVTEVHGGLISAWAMAQGGIGATILPLPFVTNSFLHQNLVLLSIRDQYFTRKPVIITKKGQYISEYAQYAMDLLRDIQK